MPLLLLAQELAQTVEPSSVGIVNPLSAIVLVVILCRESVALLSKREDTLTQVLTKTKTNGNGSGKIPGDIYVNKEVCAALHNSVKESVKDVKESIDRLDTKVDRLLVSVKGRNEKEFI